MFPELVEEADPGALAAAIVAEAGKALVLAPDTETAVSRARDLAQPGWPVLTAAGRRTEWVRGNLAPVLRHFGAGSDAAGWRVLPVIVTSRNLLSPRVLQAGIPVLTLADLPPWVRQERTRRHRGRRR